MEWDVDLFGPDEAAPGPLRPKAEAKPARPVKKKKRMARSDLLVALVKAGATGDRHLARTSAEALIADEKANKHTVLAERLTAALRTNLNGSHVAAPAPAVRGPSTRDLFVDRVPQRRLADLLLPPVTREACEELIEEQRRADVLRSHGLEPRHRILLAGPPGNGKTSLAEAIAEALSVPLLTVRYEAVIGSFLGETAGRLRRVFDFARTTPSVLFFDEFDVVGKERGDIHETGEIKRVVSSLLLQMDDLPSWTIIVAATNHSELLDRAAWRRFQLRLDLPAPGERQISNFISMFFQARPVLSDLGKSPDQLARALRGSSLAEVEDFCTNILRRFVLSLGDGRPSEIVEHELKVWRSRVSAPSKKKSEKRGGETSPSDT
ncbi:AAA family ATPase [Methylobacterium ajmalii]|jgi:ATP-dependent 26S proteasome regulatory subunit|nr:AAA family ATPase [Methylobacterium ajmalii]MBZ6416414.1 AAA family ATPase [Methylobacterium sp.]